MYYLIFFITVFFPALTYSQLETNFWFFGGATPNGSPTFDAAGLDFLQVGTSNFVNTDGRLRAFEGCATMSDRNTGELLFYTNSLEVWNKNHTVMPNGNGLIGSPSTSTTQATVILPQTDSTYYVFTLNYSLYYSILNMNMDGGNGDIVPDTKNTFVRNSLNEKLVAIEHENDNDFWVLTHSLSGDSFFAFHVTPTGVMSIPVISRIGYRYNVTDSRVGYLKGSPDGTKIVSVMHGLNSSGTYRNQLFDFDKSTGIVSNTITIGTTSNYGASFSPDSKKLYTTEVKEFPVIYGKLFQYDLCIWDSARIVNSKQVIDSSAGMIYSALQLGLDGKLYMCAIFENSLGVIHSPNKPGTLCNYQNIDVGLPLEGRISKGGLPNFLDAYFQKVESASHNVVTTSSSLCWGDTVIFSDTLNDSDILSRKWLFNDPNSNFASVDTGLNAFHLFSDTGIYLVQLIVEFPCESDTFEKTIYIKKGAHVINEELYLCEGSTLTLSAENLGYTSYGWSIGANTASIEIDSIGNYSVLLYSNNCADSGTFSILSKDNCPFEKNPSFIYIPNGFSPSNDNHNDFFRIVSNNIELIEFAIYSREGKLLFYSDNNDFTWDGKYKNKMVPPSVLTYSISYKKGGESISDRGTIILIH